MECRVGRAVRAYGHDLLPDHDRKVEIYLHVAELPTTLPKQTIIDVMKKAVTTGSNLKELVLGVPDDGMTCKQLKTLLASSSGTDEVSWPDQTADQIMWEQVQKERESMSVKLNDFKRGAADFDILQSALATATKDTEHEVSATMQAESELAAEQNAEAKAAAKKEAIVPTKQAWALHACSQSGWADGLR